MTAAKRFLKSPVNNQGETQLVLFSGRRAASWAGFIPVAFANRAARAVNTVELACILQILIRVGRFDNKRFAHGVVAAVYVLHGVRGIHGLVPAAIC